jgi:hypothetical protein
VVPRGNPHCHGARCVLACVRAWRWGAHVAVVVAGRPGVGDLPASSWPAAPAGCLGLPRQLGR